jgi:hypothetical protein
VEAVAEEEDVEGNRREVSAHPSVRHPISLPAFPSAVDAGRSKCPPTKPPQTRSSMTRRAGCARRDDECRHLVLVFVVLVAVVNHLLFLQSGVLFPI